MRQRHPVGGPVACVGVLVTALASPAAGQQPSLRALEPLVGIWHVRAESRATAYSRPGSSTAELRCDWTSSGRFLLCESRIVGGRGADTTFQLTLYGIADSGYVSYTVRPGGEPAHRSRITIDGNRWTYRDPEAGGSTVWRTVNEFVSPNEMRWEAQYSTNGGLWVTTMAGVDTKVERESERR